MRPNFNKYPSGVVPVVIQDTRTGRVLRTGFMNRKAYKRTIRDGVVTLLDLENSEVSENDQLISASYPVQELFVEKSGRSILIKSDSAKVQDNGNSITEFGERNIRYGYLPELERFVRKKIAKPAKSSRTTRLMNRGISQIAKKLGEEAVELVIEAVGDDDELLKGEASDLLYHIIVLLAARDIPLDEVLDVLRKRRK